jgi:UDP-N-acetylglucosamine--N-acetylmuramyl-(pentapeptide) pyrophosphoryl-undecaprenol N-acetylglucosamine transferase
MKHAILVAGGTGGHINAALAVGEALKDLDFDILYLTGKRPLDYKLFKGEKVLHLASRPLRTSNPLELIKNILLNFVSFILILFLYLKKRPRFIIGAGGYVCGPTLLAGFLLFIPIYIIEQNAVMGLTNKILGWFSRKIFVHFTKTKGLSPSLQRKVKVVGNPTRKAIQPVAVSKISSEIKILVFGGSLGAAQINNVIFDLLADPPIEGLSIHHQLGADQRSPTIATSVKYLPMGYIEDMQKEYEWCDIIISRAGASTISELAIIRKPVIIFPYPQATDNHQWYNALIFKDESDFTVEILNPKIDHQHALETVRSFIFKASKGELTTTRKETSSNNTCEQILKEIL